MLSSNCLPVILLGNKTRAEYSEAKLSLVNILFGNSLFHTMYETIHDRSAAQTPVAPFLQYIY